VALEDVETQELGKLRTSSRREIEREIGVENIVVDGYEEEKQIASDLPKAATLVANAAADDDDDAFAQNSCQLERAKSGNTSNRPQRQKRRKPNHKTLTELEVYRKEC
jgi:hypothetical protein